MYVNEGPNRMLNQSQGNLFNKDYLKCRYTLYIFNTNYLINASNDSRDPTCNPDTSGLSETHFHNLVS